MASLGNMYPNLPGMLVEFKDGGQALKFDQTDVKTDSMLILGTAIDGPVMEPVAVDENTAELLFGNELKANGAPNGSTLMRAFKEARANGCEDIRLMRVTGSEANAVIKAPSEEIESTTRIDENLGYLAGNDLTTLALQGTGVIGASVRVSAKGKAINVADFTVSGQTVTVNANACDAGSALTVTYNYSKQEDIVESDLALGMDDELYLQHKAVEASVKVKKTGSVVYLNATTDYIVEDNKITIIENPDDSATYVVEYKYVVEGDDFETHDVDGKLFVAVTSEQEVKLNGDLANSNDLSLYIDDTLVLNQASYRVDAVTNKVFLKKEYFSSGETVSVSYFAVKIETVAKEIKIKSVFGGDVYNESKVEVLNLTDSNGVTVTKAVKITKPQSKIGTGELPLIFSANELETFGELVEAINTYSGIFKAETNAPNELTKSLTFSESYFRNGTDGVDVSKEDLFVALSGKRDVNGFLAAQGAYQLLENYQVDWLVPAGVFADDKLLDRNKDFAYELALFCAVNSFRNKAVYGAIPMKPLQDTSLAAVQAHAKYLASFKNQYFMKDQRGSVIVDGQGSPIDLGKFITLIAGPTVTVNHQVLSLRDGHGAAGYVAYNTVLLPQSAPTNKRLPGSTGVKYNFSNAQLNEIAGNRMVCFGKKFSARGEVLQGAYIVDGPTCARPGSEYGRLSTLKVMREVSDQIREVSDPFIGESNTIEQRNALSAAISKRLDLLVTAGVILDYSFNLVATQKDQVLGQASLELGIVAPQELRKITTVMGLKR